MTRLGSIDTRETRNAMVSTNRTKWIPCFVLIFFCIQSVFSFLNCDVRSARSRITKQSMKNEIRLPEGSKDTYWDLNKVAFSLLPLAPGPRRKTVFETVVKDTIWTADQIQGVVNVNVPVRSVIVKLKTGGLLIYNPVAPTKEFISFIKDLELVHGASKYIVLGSLGLEHKALAGPFTRYFPSAQVSVMPGQWSFPVNLPSWFFGFPFGDRFQQLNTDQEDTSENPFGDEFEIEILGPLYFKSVGGFGEVAIFHKPTSTLIVTDSVVKISDTAPPIIQEDPRALLFHARDGMLDEVTDTTEARNRGWRRMTIFSLCFFPANINVEGVIDTFSKLPKVKEDMRILGKGAIPIDGGLYPWSWVTSEVGNFKSLQGNAQSPLLVAPILQKLILNREPERVLRWVDKVSKWPIKRIIPAHFQNNIKASNKQFSNAFDFLRKSKKSTTSNTNTKGTKSGLFNFGREIDLDQQSQDSYQVKSDRYGKFKSDRSASSRSTVLKSKAAGAQAMKGDLKLLDTLNDVFTTLNIVAAAEV